MDNNCIIGTFEFFSLYLVNIRILPEPYLTIPKLVQGSRILNTSLITFDLFLYSFQCFLWSGLFYIQLQVLLVLQLVELPAIVACDSNRLDSVMAFFFIYQSNLINADSIEIMKILFFSMLSKKETFFSSLQLTVDVFWWELHFPA